MKSKNLQILKKNNINIPDFFTFSFDELILDFSVIQREIDCLIKNNYENIQYYSQNLKRIIKEKYISPNLENIDFVKSSVRSSCNMEDGKDYSFAGMFETYLDVDSNDISSKILLCLQSMYNVRVLEYMILKNIDIRIVKMNVIVQKMINPDFSGIIFTSNPQGILNEMVITVGKGAGELVVSDRIETTSYFYNLTDNLYYYDGDEDLLGYHTIKELVLNSCKIKNILGFKYADIEFCIKDNKIFILQSRPITVIDDSEITIFDNSNIVESYPNTSLPLTISFANRVYTGVFRGVSRRILKDDNLFARYEDVYKNMVGSVNGSMYYKINNWYKLLQFLPMRKKIIKIWQEMLGVNNKDYNLENLNLPLLSRVKTYFSFIYEFIKAPSNMKKLNEEFERVYAQFNEVFCDNLSNRNLKNIYENISKELIDIWDITLINDMYAFIFTALTKNKLKRKNPENYEESYMSLISGIQNIESMKPMYAIIKLAKMSIQEDKQRYKLAYEEYIKTYGDRTIEELKLESKTFRTNPEILEQKLKDYTSDLQKLSQMEKEFEKSLMKKEEKTGFYARNAMLGIKNREISRLNRARIFGMVRSIFLEIGKNFENISIIEKKEDIFYLKIEEVFEIIEEEKDIKELINQRKIEYKIYEALPKYTRVIMTNTGLKKIHKSINKSKFNLNSQTLQGIGSSKGDVSGYVIVVDNPSTNIDAKDKIIITKMTDPGWVFLLASAKGIISEKGSLLSHTAIISRELKIPAIVGVDKATQVLNTGDYIRMNANTGSIKLLKKA